MKRIINILLMGCISLTLIGCAALEGNDNGLKTSNGDEADNAETVETTELVEEQSESSGTVEAEKQIDSSDIVADGCYCGCLYSDGKDRIGVEDEWGNLPCIVYDTRIEGNTLIVSGSMSYTATHDFENPETSDDMEHIFVFDDNTDFKWITGPEDSDHYTAEEYVGCLEDLKDTGLGLTIEVENGVATEVSVAP